MRSSVIQRWIFPAVGLVAFGAIDCSPTCRVHTVIELPAGVAPVASKLNLTLATGTTPIPAPAPVAGVAPENSELKALPNGFDTMFNIHGGHHWIQLTAWIDTNGSGKLDSSDLVGSLPSAIEAADHGLCSGNLTDTPPILLRVMP